MLIKCNTLQSNNMKVKLKLQFNALKRNRPVSGFLSLSLFVLWGQRFVFFFVLVFSFSTLEKKTENEKEIWNIIENKTDVYIWPPYAPIYWNVYTPFLSWNYLWFTQSIKIMFFCCCFVCLFVCFSVSGNRQH